MYEKLMTKKLSVGQMRQNRGIFKERKGWEKEENGGGKMKSLLPEAFLMKEINSSQAD